MVSNKEKQTEKSKSVFPKDLGITLPEVQQGIDVAFALWVRALLQNWRQGTVGCKGRADVSRTGKKPFKQKGTGRARAGTARSQLWRGGGVIFGPQARTKKLKITKAAKKSVLKKLLCDYINQNKVLALDWNVEGEKPQTSAAYDLLKKANVVDKKILVFLPMEDVMSYASFRNLPHVRLVFFDQVQALDLANSDYWVFFKKDKDKFKEMVLGWTTNAS